MTKQKGEAHFSLDKKANKLIKAVFLFAFALLSIFAPFLNNGRATAISSSELVLYDAETHDPKVKSDLKTVKVEAYIAGPQSSGGVWPEITEDNVRVFGNNPVDGEYALSITAFAAVATESDPHYGMYRVIARGRPEYQGSAPFTYNVSFCVATEGETQASCASKNFGPSSSRNPRGETINFSPVSADIVSLGYEDPEAEKDDVDKNCRTENGFLGVFICPIGEHIAAGVTSLYESTVAKWLHIEPKLFSRGTGEGGEMTYEAWETMRDFANLFLILYFIIMVISQITGYGISNYGIKTGLPKLLVGAVLINLSYIICQGALDLSNILGNGIGQIFEGVSNRISTPTGATTVLANASTLVMILGALVGLIWACVTNPALAIVVIGVLLGAIVSVFILSVTLGIRQAVAIVLVVLSPLALLCYSSNSNLKSLFDRWYKLFMTIWITYPLASLMVYGSALASKVLIVAWGDNMLMSIGTVGLSVVPFVFLPKVIMQSMGSISTLTAKFQNNITSRASKLYDGSGFKRWIGNEQERKRINRRAGIKFDKSGNIQKRRGLTSGLFAAQRSEYLTQAMNLQRPIEEHKLLRNDSEYFGDRQFTQQMKGLRRNVDGLGLTPSQLAQRMDQLTDAMNGMEDADQIKGSQAMVGALAGSMIQSAEGRRHLEDMLGHNRFNGPTLSPGVKSALEGMAMGMSNKEMEEMMHTNPILGSYMSSIRNNGLMATGTFNSHTIDAGTMQKITADDWGHYDESTRASMIAAAEADPNSAMAAQFNQLMEEVCDNPAKGNSAAREALNNESNSHLGDAAAYLERRNAAIENAATSLYTTASSSGDISGDFGNDLAYLETAFKKAADSGDLTGMEAAYSLMDKLASGEMSNAADSAAAEGIQRSFMDTVDNMFKTITSANYTGLAVGVDRGAVTGQIALFRSRTHDKNN